MSFLDYYSILMLPPDDGASAIEAAFRDYTRMLEHGIGLWPTYKARRRLEAFNTLLGSDLDRPSDAGFDVESAGHRNTVPLGGSPRFRSISIRDRDVYPRPEVFRERLLRNFTRAGIPKGEHQESLTVQVHVSANEQLPAPVEIAVPVFEPCRNCSGTGHVDFFRCTACAGTGLVESAEVLTEVIGRSSEPPERSLAPFGIENCYLRIEFVTV